MLACVFIMKNWFIYIILITFLSVCIWFNEQMGSISVLLGYFIGMAMLYHFNPPTNER